MILDNTDPANRNGLIQLLEDKTGTRLGNAYPKATKVRDLNIALDKFMFLAISASGRWHIDDTNQTDYAIITTNIVSDRQDYPFTIDGSTPANQILDIYRVEIADADGVFHEISPIDIATIDQALSEYKSDGGVPTEYDKVGNSIFLYATPNYNYTNGLRLYIARTSSYFLTTDTTKEAGIPNLFHPYLAYEAGYNYCADNSLAQAGGRTKSGAYTGLAQKVNEYEGMIKQYYSERPRDTEVRIKPVVESTR